MKKLAAILTALVLLLGSVALAQTLTEAELIGSWEMSGAIINGQRYDKTFVQGAGTYSIYHLQEDGTMVVEMEGETLPGSWRIVNGGVQLTIGSSPLIFHPQGEELISDDALEDPNGEVLFVLTRLETPSYVGSWEMSGAIINGQRYDKTFVQGAGTYSIYHLQEDGTMVVEMEGEKLPGSWRIVNDGVQLTIGTSPLIFHPQGEELISDDALEDPNGEVLFVLTRLPE